MLKRFRIAACLFFISLAVLSFQSLRAQEDILDRNIQLKINKEPLYRALIHINQVTGYKFSYNSDLVNEDKPVTLSSENLTLNEALDSLFNDSTLTYDLIDQHIVIHKKDDKPGISIDSASEEESRYIKLRGKVMAEESDTPLPYANVGIYNKSIGTISNVEGEFVMKIPYKYAEDTLVITYMGYENQFVPLQQFSGKQVIKMEKKVYSIQEVIVRTFDADMIMREAFRRIRENYFFSPVISTGFYRETIKRKDEYTSVSEAVIEMYKPYNKLFRSPKIQIMKSRKSANTGSKDSLNLKLKAGLEAILLLDIIHENISFFNKRYYQHYEYSVSNISHFDERNTYVVSFSPDMKADIPLYTGKLYIDVKTLALVSAEFHLNRENLRKVSESLIIRKKWDVQVKPKEVSYFVNYRRLHTSYFLNQIRGELSFKVRKRNQIFGDDFRVSFEMVTGNIDTSDVDRFDRGNVAKPHKVFIEQINSYDPSFWGEYNYIKPDEPVEKIVRKLGSKIDVLQEEK